MSLIQPRMAVAYHFFNDFDTAPQVLREVRTVYDGPLALATDYMVFNVTKKDIKTRMASVDENIWPPPPTQPKLPPDFSQRIGFSKEIISGRTVFKDIVQTIYDDINETYGTDVNPPE
jgi:ribonuclease Z